MVIDPSPMERPAAPDTHSWESFYSAKEMIPEDMPQPQRECGSNDLLGGLRSCWQCGD